MSYIWDQGFTKYDKQIIENLKSIQKEMYVFLMNEGEFHIDWGNINIIKYEFGNWKFENDNEHEKEELVNQFKNTVAEDSILEHFMERGDLSFPELIDYVKDLHPRKLDSNTMEFDFEDLDKDIRKWNPLKLAYYHTQKCLLNKKGVDEKLIHETHKIFDLNIDNHTDKMEEIENEVGLEQIIQFLFSDEEFLVNALAELDILEHQYSSQKIIVPNLKSSWSLFKDDFFHLPIEYLGGHQTFEPNLFKSFLNLFSSKNTPSIQQAMDYSKKEEPFLINGKAFLSYKSASYLLPDYLLGRFGSFELKYTPLIDNEEAKPIDYIVSSLMTFIKLSTLLIKFLYVSCRSNKILHYEKKSRSIIP